MRLARLGCFFATRLSFMPTLLRRLGRCGAALRTPLWELDAEGYGTAVLAMEVEGRTYSLVAFSQPLAPEARSDRVIAEAWDATFVLYDGQPDAAEIARLAANAPRQEAGRYSPRDLVLSRANKSVRMFEHLVERLSRGSQPDEEMVRRVGYLMRTTAVYGNGKFGIADRARIAARPEFAGAFQAEMLAVYLIRCFTVALAEHVARARAPETAVALAPRLKRYLGVGNSTGLGMAPFLVSHPVLINNWVLARETALSRVRSQETADPAAVCAFPRLLARALAHVAEWTVEDSHQSRANARLAADLSRLVAACPPEADLWSSPRPWDRLFRWAEDKLGTEAQELLVALLLEPHGALVDDLACCMTAAEGGQLDPAMRVAELRALLHRDYDWALAIDFTAPAAARLFWYVSEEKLEPRLGERASEPGAEREMPLAIARDMQALAQALDRAPGEESLAAFLLAQPQFRHLARRAQTVAQHPYGEIRDNLIGAGMRPIDLLRCKLSFFGAAKFDPKSDRWTRIAMYQGAPLPEELGTAAAESWCLPVLGSEQAVPA
jgi:hypothetical protein